MNDMLSGPICTMVHIKSENSKDLRMNEMLSGPICTMVHIKSENSKDLRMKNKD